jgi:predicted Zn-ribbon and HTH transcriptional regulator
MDIATWKICTESHIEQLQTLIERLPQKGDKQEDCQRVCLQQRLNELESAINGTEAEDLTENTHTCMECGWTGMKRTRCPICTSEDIEEI